MDDFLFTIDRNKTNTTTNKMYCLIGTEDFIDDKGHPSTLKDTEKVLAKTIQRNSDPIQYFIRLSNNNKLYNPISPTDEDSRSSVVDNTCRPTTRFTTVNQMVFNYYLQFLSSKNTLWLNKAEREII